MDATIQVVYYTGPYTRTLLPTAGEILERAAPARRERVAGRADVRQKALDIVSLRLLECAMVRCGVEHFRLADVLYRQTGGVSEKPRFGGGEVDFSVTHTDGFAACAAVRGTRVGIDAEAIRDFDPRVVRRLIRADSVFASGLTADNGVERWTMLEAVLKAAGKGVMHGREIDWRFGVHGEFIARLDATDWYLERIDCDAAYSVHIATDRNNVRVVVDAPLLAQGG